MAVVLWSGSGVDCTEVSVYPVSYTHLDVYKRQAYGIAGAGDGFPADY